MQKTILFELYIGSKITTCGNHQIQMDLTSVYSIIKSQCKRAGIEGYTIIKNCVGMWHGVSEKTTILRIVVSEDEEKKIMTATHRVEYLKNLLKGELFQQSIMMTRQEIEREF